MAKYECGGMITLEGLYYVIYNKRSSLALDADAT